MGDKRQPNFSTAEEAVLLGIIKKYRSIIENKKTDNASNVAKKHVWLRVADEFNTNSNEVYRSWLNLRKKYENMKKNAKKILAEQKGLTSVGDMTISEKTMEELLESQINRFEPRNDYEISHTTFSTQPHRPEERSDPLLKRIKQDADSQDEEDTMGETCEIDDSQSDEICDIPLNRRPITWKPFNYSNSKQGNSSVFKPTKTSAQYQLSDWVNSKATLAEDQRKIMWEEHALKLEQMREKHALYLKQQQEEHEQKIRHREELHQADLAKRMGE